MDQDNFRILLVVFLFPIFVMAVLTFGSADERSRCESLNRQGVKAYVSKGFITDQCIVVGREYQ